MPNRAAEFRDQYLPSGDETPPQRPRGDRAAARQILAGYYAHCTALDDCLGQLCRRLKVGLERNTILVFTADHGDLFGSHGGRNKQQPFEESIRVPLMIRWPAGLGTGPAGAANDPGDLMPTLLGLCGLSVPKTVEGLDYGDYRSAARTRPTGAALFGCLAPLGSGFGDRRTGYRGVRTARRTYVRDLKGPWLFSTTRPILTR